MLRWALAPPATGSFVSSILCNSDHLHRHSKVARFLSKSARSSREHSGLLATTCLGSHHSIRQLLWARLQNPFLLSVQAVSTPKKLQWWKFFWNLSLFVFPTSSVTKTYNPVSVQYREYFCTRVAGTRIAVALCRNSGCCELKTNLPM